MSKYYFDVSFVNAPPVRVYADRVNFNPDTLRIVLSTDGYATVAEYVNAQGYTRTELAQPEVPPQPTAVAPTAEIHF